MSTSTACWDIEPEQKRLDGFALLEMFQKLGKHKTSGGMGGCLYINKLSDVYQKVLAELIKTSFEYMKRANT